MDEVRISFYQQLPLVDILWAKDIRPQLDFLKKNSTILSNVINDIQYQRKNGQSQYLSKIFLLDYGHLRWHLSQDLYIYTRNCRNLSLENEILRPLTPFSPKPRKWILDSSNFKSVFNGIVNINIFPSLAVEIVKSCSLKVDEEVVEKGFLPIIENLKQEVYSEQLREKMRILKAIFTDLEEHSYRMSDITTIIECTIEHYVKLKTGKEILSLKRIPKIGWIDIVNNQTIIIVYSETQPSRKFRKRITRAISYPYLLKSLRKRINYLLNVRIDSFISFEEKINLIEYVIAVLNPEYYSSKTKNSYLFPFNYQRILFLDIYNNINERVKFDKIVEEVVEIVSNWDSHELCTLLLQRNLISNILRKNFCKEKLKVQKPHLNERETVLINFMIKEFYVQLKTDGLSPKIVKNISSYAGKSANYFREHLHKWMKGKFDLSLISQAELKKTPITLLENMHINGFVNINYVEKTRTKLLYSLNLENKFIQKLIFEGVEIQ